MNSRVIASSAMSDSVSALSRPATRGSVAAAAAAQSVAEPASISFSQIMLLSLDTIAIQLKTGEYKDVQELCKFIGVSAKGARAELEARVLEFKTKLESGEVCMPTFTGARGGATVELLATPETRPGRHREPYLGGPPVSWPVAGALPTLPGATLLNHAASDEDMGAPDPLQHRDPWKHFALSTPQTRRSQDVHSGLTPMVPINFKRWRNF